jgi:hypothetical protein
MPQSAATDKPGDVAVPSTGYVMRSRHSVQFISKCKIKAKSYISKKVKSSYNFERR